MAITRRRGFAKKNGRQRNTLILLIFNNPASIVHKPNHKTQIRMQILNHHTTHRRDHASPSSSLSRTSASAGRRAVPPWQRDRPSFATVPNPVVAALAAAGFAELAELYHGAKSRRCSVGSRGICRASYLLYTRKR